MKIQTYRLFEILIYPKSGKLFHSNSQEFFEKRIEKLENLYDFHKTGDGGYHIIFELNKQLNCTTCKKQVMEISKELIEISE